jgi:hypothetical protein
MTPILIPVSKLDFDLQNPRYPPQTSQRDALEKILLDSFPKIQKLAEHIIENGQNPIDLIACFETESRRFVVLEGNRRTAVLKVLSKPTLLDSLPAGVGIPAFVKKMKQLAAKAQKNAVNRTNAVLFTSREDADVWISLKHTGQNEGAGTVEWDGSQRARFRKGDVGLNLLDFGKKNGWFSEEDLTAKGSFPISTLNRLLADPAIRNALGMELSDGKLNATVPIEELGKGVAHIVSDLATGTWNVSKLKNKVDRKHYLDQIPHSSLPTSARSTMPWAIDLDASPTIEVTPIAQPRTRARPLTRRSLIPKHFIVKTSLDSPRLNKIYDELKSLSVEKSPNSVAVLLRTFIELSLDDFIAREKVNVVKKNVRAMQASLADKATSTAAHLKAAGKLDKGQEAIVSRLVGAGSDPMAETTSITTLHAFVHNRKVAPLGSELLTIWENIAEFMRLITHV